MIFWIFAALMIAGAAGALAWPLLRKGAGGAAAAEYDLEVYRDQLAELERDHGRGLISGDEIEAARTEIARRMLAADDRLKRRPTAGPWLPGIATWTLLAILAGSLVVGAAATYPGLSWIRRPLWTGLTAITDVSPAVSDWLQPAITIAAILFGLVAAVLLAMRLPVRIIAAALAIILPAGTVPFYLQLGDPGAPDMPLAQRTNLPVPGEGDERARKQIAELTRAAEANPGDAEAWLRLAGAYRSIEMFGDAAAAYRRAIGLGPVTGDINSDFAETLVMVAQGTVTPEAHTIFEAVLATFPGDPQAQYYLALADYQAGGTREALDRWAALIASSPEGAPWLGIVRENLAQAAEDLGLDVAAVTPDPLPAIGGGETPQLTTEHRAEIEAMNPAERDAMIHEMVAGLDARLRDDPMDLAGWERLIRARMVLGERDAAQDALGRALETFAQAPFPTRTLVELAAELQLGVPEGGVEAPDVGAMVERLAARLEDDPDDLEGWMMLARSYTVLGEPEKARDAIANAVRLAPDNSDVLALQARAIREANGGADNDETVAILRRVLALAPNHMEALWFVGNAEADAGNKAAARELLERMLAQIPEDNPDREFVMRRIEGLDG